MVLSNRCAITCTDNTQGRFDSTKFSEECRFRKFGVTEPLHFRKQRQCEGRFDSTKFSEWFPFKNLVLSNRCAAALLSSPLQMRLDSTTFSLQEILVLSNRCAAVLVIYPLQLLTTNRGGSIAPNFPNGVVSENLVLPNRCIFRKQRQRRAVRYHEVF